MKPNIFLTKKHIELLDVLATHLGKTHEAALELAIEEAVQKRKLGAKIASFTVTEGSGPKPRS